jgi:hemoglobin
VPPEEVLLMARGPRRAVDQATLYAALGGDAGMAAIVDTLYAHVLANPRLAAFFAHTSLEELKRHQREFLAFAFSGASAYTGRSLKEAHAGRGITDADFDRMVHHFAAAFDSVGVAEDVRTAAIRNLEAHRPEVVGPS